MKARVLTVVILILVCVVQAVQSDTVKRDYWPTKAWRTVSPEKAGFDSLLLRKMDEQLRAQLPQLASLVIVRNGFLVHEMYLTGEAGTLRDAWSETKSVICILIGILFKNGIITDLDQPLLGALPELGSPRQPADAAKITIRHALTMTAGLPDDVGEGTLSVTNIRGVLADDLKDVLGERFGYNGTNANMLSLLITRKTGGSAEAFAATTLFKTLGIARYMWRTRLGVSNGAVGLALTSRDLAKIGYLYLNEGRWGEEQLVSKEWVQRSTSPLAQTGETDRHLESYGYLWWVGNAAGFPSYLALGVGGQITMVIPKLDLVVVVTTNEVEDEVESKYLEIVDNFIIPAIK